MKGFFPHDVLRNLSALSMFNLNSIPTEKSSIDFSVCSHSEIVLSNHYFVDENKIKEFFSKKESFKFDLYSMRKKWVSLIEDLVRNNLKLL